MPRGGAGPRSIGGRAVRAARRIYRRAAFNLLHRRGFSCELHERAAIRPVPAGPGRGAFFGYYDKSPWSFDGRYYLVHLIDPHEPTRVRVAVWEPDSGDLRPIDSTPAFNFQQGAMLQWLGKRNYDLIYNTVIDGRLAAEIRDGRGGESRGRLPLPVQTVAPDGSEALSLNYRRLAGLRPDYGYEVEVDNFSPELPDDEDGIWRIDIGTGESELIINLAELASGEPDETMRDARHKVNHLMYSPSGRRFVFVHRWLGPRGSHTRLYTADPDGGNLRLLTGGRPVSHFIWRDDHGLLVWLERGRKERGYYLFEDRAEGSEPIQVPIGDRYGDGHPSYSPDGRRIVTDTYPDIRRLRRLLLFDTVEGRTVEIGRFLSPWGFEGPARCDLHPRFRPDGEWVSIDSTHEGFRNCYIIDISDLPRSGGI